MGGGSSALKQITYSVPVTEKRAGESCVYRNPSSQDKHLHAQDLNTHTLQEGFLNSVNLAPNNPCIGIRVGEGVKNLTYQQVHEQALAIGSAILHQNLAPELTEYNQHRLRIIGVYAKNRPEWMVLDVATTLFKFVLSPLYDSLNTDAVQFVIAHSNFTTCFCSAQAVDSILLKEPPPNSRLKYLVCFDTPTEAQLSAAASYKLSLLTWSDLLTVGRKNQASLVQVQGEDCFSLCYTSGTTGLPKAAMISHKNIVLTIDSRQNSELSIRPSDVHLSYLPLAHLMERLIFWAFIKKQAHVIVSCGDILKLREDLQIVRPTIFFSVPRIFNRLYASMSQGIQGLEGCKKGLATQALATKLYNLKNYCQYTHCFYDAIVFKNTKAALGGRVRYMITGSAPLGAEVLDFLKVAIACPFIEGYGQTESTGGSFFTIQNDVNASGIVGGPSIITEFKVIDVPEMNYLSTDLDTEGRSTPRGEVCLRGPGIFMGYYKDDAKTREAIDNNCWLHTGDVGVILPNGALKIIDRSKNIFKLSQGEYVAPERIEQVYIKTTGVDGIFVHGDSLQSYCVAVCNVNKEYLNKWASQEGLQGSYEELCKTLQARKFILTALTKVGKESGLIGFEQAKNIYLEPRPFLDLNILTVTQKTQRNMAAIRFRQQIDAMYAEGDNPFK